MWNRIKLQVIFNPTIIATLAGIIISVAASIIVGQTDFGFKDVNIRNFQIIISIMAIMISILGLSASIIIENLRHDVDYQLESIGLSSLWMAEQKDSNEGFNRTRDIVLKAEHSILVLSHYIPPQIDMSYTNSRRGYLANGIESVIKQRLLNSDGPPIIYRRIVQSERANESNGVLQRYLLSGDPQTFDHCSRIFSMLEGQVNSNIHVDFRISKPIPSFPSTLIVDDRYVLFALSSRGSRIGTNNNNYAIVGVLLIEDRDGRTVRGFKNMFDRFYENSYSINRIEESK